jgi:hypothetical protein
VPWGQKGITRAIHSRSCHSSAATNEVRLKHSRQTKAEKQRGRGRHRLKSLTISIRGDVSSPLHGYGADLGKMLPVGTTDSLLFNVEVNLCYGPVLGYLRAVSSISKCATRAHFRPRTVFAASATAFSAAFAKLSLEVPTTSIIFCAMTSLL